MHRFPLSALLLLLPSLPASAVDEFLPYTDGRLGGCYKTEGGQLYNCTRNPPKAGSRTVKQIDTEKDDDDDGVAETDAVVTRAEVEALRRELQALKQERAEEQALSAAARGRRERTERDAQALAQADEDAAMAAYNAIESAKDSERLEELQRQTEACRRTLEKGGYRIIGAGACRAPDGIYVNCPAC